MFPVNYIFSRVLDFFPVSSPAGPQLRASELNRELQISVGTAGPQPRAPDLSGQSPLRSGDRGWGPALPMSDRMPERMPDRMSE